MNSLARAVNPLLFFALMLVSAWCRADCYAMASTSYAITIPTGTRIYVPQNSPVGPTGPVISVGRGPTAGIYCPAESFTLLKFATPMTATALPDVYETNIPGIGVKVWNDYSGTVVIGNDLKYWYSIGTGYYGSAWLTNIRLQFYVTGPVSTGYLALRTPTIEAWANNAISTTGGARYSELSIAGSLIIKAAACETPDITVNMKSHNAAEFSVIGSTSAATPFDFTINRCDPGINSVKYSFTPGPGVSLLGSDNHQYLSLNSSSTARGVGIQVQYRDGTLVPFNTPIHYTGYNFATGGNYSIPMQARYIKTGPITGGTANSSIEFTMSYE